MDTCVGCIKLFQTYNCLCKIVSIATVYRENENEHGKKNTEASSSRRM